MKFLSIEPGHITELNTDETSPRALHKFDADSINAINAALAARRPLLVRGEPGIGKSQLARAAAKELGRAFLQHVVDVRTESRDLLWNFDAVKRLADAQLGGKLHDTIENAQIALAVENYLQPRVLWWAFDWTNALKQAEKVKVAAPAQRDGGKQKNGCLVLIDEIDKGESDVPNGLLEALGSGSFTPEGRVSPLIATGVESLVIITTNEERALPDAFLRRCLVLQLSLPELPEAREEFCDLLKGRGEAHFPELDIAVLKKAAEILAGDRERAQENHQLPLPGQAEYLDMLRAVGNLCPDDTEQQISKLKQVAAFALRKHPDAKK